MARIAVDVDSTLYDFETLARDEFLKLAIERDDKELFQGAYHPWVEWRSPADSCGVPAWLEVIERCHSTTNIKNQQPFEGSVDACWDLVESGHDLIYLSSRDSETFKATREWLKACEFPDSDKLVVCGSDKSEHLKDCQYLIDDRPKTVVEFVNDFAWRLADVGRIRRGESARPRLAFVKAYGYNQNLTDLPSIYLGPTWEAFRYYMTKKGLIPDGA